MKCPKCQFENPDDAQFCIECGNSIEFHCPKCEAITPATGKFCKACGYKLIQPSKAPPKEVSLDEKIRKIQKYLPQGLTEKILAQRAIRSAHAIHREMVRFSHKIRQEKEGIQSLKMRIGIHTGPIVVGTLGNDLRVEFKGVGDTVNLASRI